MITELWNKMYISLVKNIFYSRTLIEIMHNAWEVIEDNGEKLHELWFTNNGITLDEEVLHKKNILKMT